MKKSQCVWLFSMLLFIGCSGHVAPVPNVTLKRTSVYEATSKELRDAIAFGKSLSNSSNVEPIYLVVENELMLQRKIDNPSLPRDFRVAAMYAATVFGDKVVVLTDRGIVAQYLNDKSKKDRVFQIEGAITGFNENGHIVDSGFDVGLDFGKGKGSTDTDSDFRNTDKVSSLTVSIFLKQNNRICAARKNKIDIHSSNRGYYMGVSINGSGLGFNAHRSKKEDVGEALDRVLYYSLHQMIKKVVGRQLIASNKKVMPVTKRAVALKQKKEYRDEPSDYIYSVDFQPSYIGRRY